MELQYSIKKQMELEKVIEDCRGLPYLLIQVAELLTKNHHLWRIVVEKPGGDRLKGTQAHSKAKRQSLIVYVRKDKDTAHSYLQRGRGGNRSGDTILECIEEGTSAAKSKDKAKSKEKTIKASKNSKRKDRKIYEDEKYLNQNSATSSFIIHPPQLNDSPKDLDDEEETLVPEFDWSYSKS